MARTKILFGHKQLAVEWLGAEDAKQNDRSSSAGGREACVFRAKKLVTCDPVTVQWGLSQN